MARPNQHATETNGLKLVDFSRAANERIPAFNISYVVAADASTNTVTVENADSATFITVKITDSKGVDASHTFSPVADLDSQAIDTSGLDSAGPWVLRVYGAQTGLDCDTTKENYCITIAAPQGATGDTTPS